MAMAGPIPTNTDIRPMSPETRLLTLVQWASPGYPLGAFAYSHGIESAIEARLIRDCDTTAQWLEALLTDGSARSETVWLSLGHQAESFSGLKDLDALARAYAATSERLLESRQQGEAFARTTNAVWNLDLPGVILPLAFGHAARCLGLPRKDCILIYLQAFLANLVSAAVRLIPLGQTEGQTIIAGLAPLVAGTADSLCDATPADIHSNTFMSDIMAMRHETLQPRLFQT